MPKNAEVHEQLLVFLTKMCLKNTQELCVMAAIT